MVGSLSSAMEEVYVAKETIRKWNQQNAELTGKLFMPIEWTSEPEAVQNVDLVIGIIDNWIDNPKFIEDRIETGKPAMLFFNAAFNPSNTINGEYERVRAFENRIKGLCLCSVFSGIEELNRTLVDWIDAF